MSEFVTRTATPETAVCAEVVHVIEVELTTVTPVHAVAAPIVTEAPVRKPVPVMVTFCNPAIPPDVGVIAVTVGAATNVNAPALVPDCVSGLVTTMSFGPALCVGVVHVSDVDETNATDAQAVPPTEIVAPETKSVPVIVIDVPPIAGPDAGDTDDTTGEGT